ncbi:Fc.00g006000.m01.CDS01 [Cosmosporella sp. VM-42]
MSTGRTSHLERTAREPRDERLHNVILSHIDQVNAHVRLLRLALVSGPIKFLPGQWLDTFVPGVSRAGGFTISSPPSAALDSKSPYLELAIQKSPGSPPAAWLWRPREEILNSTLQVRVGGSFVFPPTSTALGQIRRAVLVAGGVGINPLMSMLSHIAELKDEVDVQVVYASKLPAGGLGEMLFVTRIAELFAQGKLKGLLRLFITGLSNGEEVLNIGDELKELFAQAKIDIQTRRFSSDDVAAAIGNRDSTLIYVCGPPTMTDEIVEVLTSPEGVGLEKRQVLTEKWW